MKRESLRRSLWCLREDDSGSILVLTLVVLGLLTAFCVQLGYVTRQKLTETRKIEKREHIRLAVDAGVKAGTVIVRESEGEAKLSGLQPGYASGRFARGTGGSAGVARYVYTDDLCDVVMTVTDEGGKINVNRAPYVLIASVLEEVAEIDEDTAKELACSIVDWRDSNDTYCHPQFGAEGCSVRGPRRILAGQGCG